MYHQNIMSYPQTKAGRPRNLALDQAILSAAARQLGESGYARMSLESVAAAAGTTVPSLRRRYRNKAELAAAVIGSLRVEEPPAGAPTPRAHALAILENFHSNLRATPALAVLGSLLAEEERHPELLHLFKTASSSRGGRCSGKRWRPATSRTPLTSTRSPACSSAPSTAATSPSPASPTTGQTAC